MENRQNYLQKLRKIRQKYGCIASNSKSFCPSLIQTPHKNPVLFSDRNHTQTHQSSSYEPKIDLSYQRALRMKQIQNNKNQSSSSNKKYENIFVNREKYNYLNIDKNNNSNHTQKKSFRNQNNQLMIGYAADLLRKQNLNLTSKERVTIITPTRNNRFQRDDKIALSGTKNYSVNTNYSTRRHAQNQNQSNSSLTRKGFNKYQTNRVESLDIKRPLTSFFNTKNEIESIQEFSLTKLRKDKQNFNNQKEKNYLGIGDYKTTNIKFDSSKQNRFQYKKTDKKEAYNSNNNGKWSMQNFNNVQKKIQSVLNKRF